MSGVEVSAAGEDEHRGGQGCGLNTPTRPSQPQATRHHLLTPTKNPGALESHREAHREHKKNPTRQKSTATGGGELIVAVTPPHARERRRGAPPLPRRNRSGTTAHQEAVPRQPRQARGRIRVPHPANHTTIPENTAPHQPHKSTPAPPVYLGKPYLLAGATLKTARHHL